MYKEIWVVATSHRGLGRFAIGIYIHPWVAIATLGVWTVAFHGFQE